MLDTARHWQLDVIAHTDRMIAAAMDQLGDANEARWVVHRVLLHAMTDMSAPASRRELDGALGLVLRSYPPNAA